MHVTFIPRLSAHLKPGYEASIHRASFPDFCSICHSSTTVQKCFKPSVQFHTASDIHLLYSFVLQVTAHTAHALHFYTQIPVPPALRLSLPDWLPRARHSATHGVQSQPTPPDTSGHPLRQTQRPTQVSLGSPAFKCLDVCV